MKHKHYEMIVAKAANMDLIQLYKAGGVWQETSEQFNMNNGWAFFEDSDYFLCMPKHKEACLWWLNGGEVEFEYDGKWHSCSDWSNVWCEASGFTCDSNNLRIKPKKEKRWIVWNEDWDAYHCVFFTNPAGSYSANFKCSIHEIEVEV